MSPRGVFLPLSKGSCPILNPGIRVFLENHKTKPGKQLVLEGNDGSKEWKRNQPLDPSFVWPKNPRRRFLGFRGAPGRSGGLEEIGRAGGKGTPR